MENSALAMTLRDDLTDAVLARSTMQRRQVNYPELEEWVAGRIDPYERVFVGRSSVTIMDTHTKLIGYDEWPVTSAELAREYLRRVFSAPDVVHRTPRPGAPGFGWQAPVHCSPINHGTFAYVDIVSAYWQLLSVFGPNDVIVTDRVIRGGGEWLAADEVGSDRRLRHCVIGSVFGNSISWYRRGVLTTTPKTSPWSNPTLKRYCMQTLHALCGQIAQLTPLHAWLTDAAIVDAGDAADVCAWLQDAWAVASAVQAYGAGAVLTPTTYAVGDKASLDLQNGTHVLGAVVPKPFSNLRRVPSRRLQSLRLEAMS